MKKSLPTSLVASVLGVLALAACGGSSSDAGSSDAAAPPAASATTSAPAGADLGVADSSVGQIVVDGKGMTAYIFDVDKKGSGKSSCAGECLTAWPPIAATSDTPQVSGVTGEVGTITATDGSKQITVNGYPLYTFASDSAPGDVKGQGVKDVWHVMAPDGTEIKAPAK